MLTNCFGEVVPQPRAVWAHRVRGCGRHLPFKESRRACQRREERRFINSEYLEVSMAKKITVTLKKEKDTAKLTKFVAEWANDKTNGVLYVPQEFAGKATSITVTIEVK